LTHGVDYVFQKLFPANEHLGLDFEFPSGAISFVYMHFLILPFCKNWLDFIWFVITVGHGLGHIFHPALHGTKFNDEYTPLYDFIFHAAQCYCVAHYHPHLSPFGYFFGLSTMTGAVIAHFDPAFLHTPMWLLLAWGGIFGTYYHHMLLDKQKKTDPQRTDILIANFILWTSIYAGYVYRDGIPIWDLWMNWLGAFRLWFFHYFFVHYAFVRLEKYFSPCLGEAKNGTNTDDKKKKDK